MEYCGGVSHFLKYCHQECRTEYGMFRYAAALHGMTKNLAVDLKPIRVNLVSPGAIYTELWRTMSEEVRSKMFKDISSQVPTGKIGKRKLTHLWT